MHAGRRASIQGAPKPCCQLEMLLSCRRRKAGGLSLAVWNIGPTASLWGMPWRLHVLFLLAARQHSTRGQSPSCGTRACSDSGPAGGRNEPSSTGERWAVPRAGHTRCSKAGSLEMGDLSPAQARAYLAAQGVAEEDAAGVVEVTGGRLLHLLSALEVLAEGGSVQGVRALVCLACTRLGKQQRWCTVIWGEAARGHWIVHQQQPERAGLRLVKALVAQQRREGASPGISTVEWNRLVPAPAVRLRLCPCSWLACVRLDAWCKRRGALGACRFVPAQDKDVLLSSNCFARRYCERRYREPRVVFEGHCVAMYAKEHLV